jgi:hypothetical protein
MRRIVRVSRNPFLWLINLGMALGGVAQAESSITILPGDFTLAGKAARQRVVVERMENGRPAGQVADGMTLKSSDEKIVTIQNGIVLPVANGETTITAEADGQTATVKVTVTGADQPFHWSFRNHVQSVLVKAGCNSGACHGAAAGK